MRFAEDWSSYEPEEGLDRLKRISLGAPGSYLSLGGQLRLRGEGWSGFAFGESDRFDDSFGLFRARFHADLWLDSVRVFVEGKSALATSRDLPGGLRTLDVDSIDFLNGFVEWDGGRQRGDGVGLLVGRQELLFGKERLVSPLDWSNTRRTFDGVRGIVESGDWRIDGFWTRPVTIRKYTLNSSTLSDADFFGIYSSGPVTPDLNLDLYWLALEDERSTFTGITASESRHTLGFRLVGSLPGEGDFDGEFAYQFGEHGDRKIRAFMAAWELGKRISGAPAEPRVKLGLDYASGQEDPSDDTLSTFNQLFPLGHAYLGYVDLVGRQNIWDLSPGLGFSLTPRLALKADLHFFWRAEREDALYNAGGGVVRAGTPQSSRRVGTEIDVTARYPLSRHTLLAGGYSRFLAAEFIEETGSSDSVDFLHFTVQFTF